MPDLVAEISFVCEPCKIIQIIELMKIIILLTILALGAKSCEEQISFGYSSCTFYVNYQNGQCVDFSFNKCQWTECTAYYYDNNGTSYCAHYTTYYDPSWNACTNRCCDGDVNYPQTYSSITQCQEYLNSKFKLIITIVMSILGGILFIVCMACCCNGCCCNCLYDCLESARDCCVNVLRCECFRRSHQQEEPPKPYEENQSKQMTNMQFQPRWRFQSLNNTKLNNVCSVCLEDRPSLQLQCGHVFHRKCILACLKKKHECILCRATDIDRVNVYCEQCFSAYFQGNLKDSIIQLQSKKQICDGCNEAGYV